MTNFKSMQELPLDTSAVQLNSDFSLKVTHAKTGNNHQSVADLSNTTLESLFEHGLLVSDARPSIEVKKTSQRGGSVRFH